MNMKIILGVLFVFALMGIISAGECDDAGYKCYDMACPSGKAIVESISCPSIVGNRPEVCCKEVIDSNVQPTIIINKQQFQRGDTLTIDFKLPYFASCSYYFINSEGMEKEEGAGGCGTGVSLRAADIVVKLEQLFGSAEPGVYKIKIIAKKEDYADIIKTKEFQIVKEIVREEVECVIKDGEGTCNLLGTAYQIKHKGCSDQIELEISYNGLTEKFNNLNPFSEIFLKDGTKIKLNGVPCTVYQANLILRKNDLEISEEGTYTVKMGYVIKINEVQAEIASISWALSGDTEPRIVINGNNAQSCILREGEECKMYYGPASRSSSRNLRIKANSIDINEASPEESVASITLTKIYEVIKIVPDENPEEIAEKDSSEFVEVFEKDIPQDKRDEEIIILCSGCELNDKCYPFGFRKEGKFCSDSNNEFIEQKKAEISCENNFECSSNICVSSKCVNPSLIEGILNWFKKLFGIK